MAKLMKYWYDPDNGAIKYRTEQSMAKFDLPYIEAEQFNYAEYRVDTQTKQFVKLDIEISKNPRGN